ncbi:MAG TPA: MFS transporter [Bryobacteraceae bacterium]|jgi:MFS family permease
MAPSIQTRTFREVLALPGIRRLWLAQIVSVAGDFLAIFAVLGIASFRLHATPAQVTGVTISYMLPLAIFGPLAGVFVDRCHPRRAMMASDVARAVLVLLLLFPKPYLPAIYATLFAVSTFSTFFIPAQSILLRSLVPRDRLLSANAIMQQALLVIRMVSPALAGALVARFGTASCFWFDTLSFLFSALMLRGIVIPSSPRPLPKSRALLNDLTPGIRFILAHSSIAFAITAMTAATFAVSCFSPLLAVFVRDILQAGVRVFGWISASVGLGMIAGTRSVHRFAQRNPRSPRQLIVLSLGVMASGITLLAVSHSPAAAGVGVFTTGAGVGLLMVPAQTLIQSETPLPMVGRVSSAVMSLISAAQILGLALSGSLAAAIGLRPLFLSSAALLAGLAIRGLSRLSGDEPINALDKLNTVN